MNKLSGFLAAVLVVLSGCGRGDKNTFSGCAESFASKDAIALTFTSSRACLVDDWYLSVDGERDSFATMTFPAAGCVQQLVATLWDPAQFSGGNVGAILGLPDNLAPGAAVTLVTWLDGEVQDSSVHHGGATVTDTDRAQEKYYSFQTGLPFDEVDLTIHLAGPVEPGTVRVHEFCAHR